MLWLLLIISLASPWIAKYIWPHEITYKEVIVQILIVLVVTVAVFFASYYGRCTDIEVWNGMVTAKKKVKVGCKHAYSCGCVTVNNGKTTTTICQTCYEHNYDIDWRVYSNIGEIVNINRIDRQGLRMPPRWDEVVIGEPFSVAKTFTNYILNDPSSLFNNADLIDKYKDLIPKYPNNIYDYYRNDHVVTVKLKVPDFGMWRAGLGDILRTLGPARKSNIVVVLTSITDAQYPKAIREAWLGGKKNDTIVVIGYKNYPTPASVGIFSWSTDKLLDVNLRQELMAQKKLDSVTAIPIIEKEVLKHFKKRSMEDYSYLMDIANPPFKVILITLIISLVFSVACSYTFYKIDLE